MLTIADALEKDRKKRQAVLCDRLDDGLFIRLMKRFLRSRVWWLGYELFFAAVLKRTRLGARDFGNLEECRGHVWTLADCYAVLMGALLLTAYTASFLLPQYVPSSLVGVAAVAIAVLPLYRTLEIVAFVTESQLSHTFVTHSPMRATVKTAFHYCEVAVAFGTFYLTAAHLTNDPFGEVPLTDSFPNALYFSFTTLCTIGYGDFGPKHWVGKMLVIPEVLLGLLVLIVVIQRTVPVRILEIHKTGVTDDSPVNGRHGEKAEGVAQ